MRPTGARRREGAGRDRDKVGRRACSEACPECWQPLAACSPSLEWWPVALGHQRAAGGLPDTTQARARPVSFEGQTLELTMHSARAGGVLFALGSAELPPGWGSDPAVRRRLARWAVE